MPTLYQCNMQYDIIIVSSLCDLCR